MHVRPEVINMSNLVQMNIQEYLTFDGLFDSVLRSCGKGKEQQMTSVYYGEEGQEQLRAKTIDEAVYEILDYTFPNLPESVEVVKWVQMEVQWQHFHPLEDMLERLDEDYGDQETGTEPTDTMIEAEKVFTEAIKKDYHVYMCEPQGKPIIISTAYWLMQNRQLNMLLEAQQFRNREKIGLRGYRPGRLNHYATDKEPYAYYG